MMNDISTNVHQERANVNIIEFLKFRLLPYWPVLIFSVVVCLLGALAYIKISVPSYEAWATLLIKDEKKGTDDARMIESLNVFSAKKIVENEIEVIKSRALMREVAINLGLYAPITMEKELKSMPAYSCSPIVVLAKEPDKIEEINKVYFKYDSLMRTVRINNVSYPLNNWVNTPMGELRFEINTRLKRPTDKQLYFSLISVKRIVTGLQANLNVKTANKLSSVVNLQFVDKVPERAEDILNELINVYNRAGINDKNALADNTLQFIEERLNHVKAEMDSVDSQIQIYRSQQGAVNLSEQGSLFLRNVGENDQRSAMLTMQLAVLNEVQSFINSGKSKANIVPSTMGIEDPVLSRLISRLSEAQIEYQKLKVTTAENNPVLISLSDEIKEIRPQVLENIRVQKLNLQSRIDQLQQTNSKYSKVLQSIPEKERRLLEISRRKTIINDVYDFLLQKKEETAISYASTVPDSRIVDVAESSIKPVSPKKVIVLGIAMVLAFVMAIGIIYFKDFSSSKVLFRSEIESVLSFPVAGELKQIKSKDAGVFSEDLRSPFYQIIANLGLHSGVTSKKILLTSSTSGEGKSYIAGILAMAIAETGKRIVLVDLDCKKKTLTTQFNLLEKAGISEFVNGTSSWDEVIQHTNLKNISLVSPGNSFSSFTSVLLNPKIDEVISNLENSFDIILVDSSSIDPIADVCILQKFADLSLYIVRHRVTPKNTLVSHQDKITSVTNGNVKIIFNGIKPRGYFNGIGYGYGLNV